MGSNPIFLTIYLYKVLTLCNVINNKKIYTNDKLCKCKRLKSTKR